jgi:transcription elongation factor SPT5
LSAFEIRKYFRTGDHVKVINGKYEGDTGLIVRVEDNLVILISDITNDEVSFIFFMLNRTKKDGKARFQ